MKILLLNPVTDNGLRLLRVERCQVKTVSLWPPLSLAYCASVLKKRGFQDVSIVDAEAEDISYQKTISQIIQAQPDVLVVQDTTPTIYSDINLVKKVKEELPQTKVVFMGLHSTVRPQDVLGPYVDFAIQNEPEYTLAEFVQSLVDNSSVEDIKGLSYRQGTQVKNNPLRDLPKDIGEIPFPARELLQNHLYVNPMTGKPFTILKTSRGCPYKCTYCTAVPYNGAAWRSRSAESILSEIQEVVKKYHVTDFLFHSDTFNLDKNLVIELCRRINEENLKITWMSNCRVDRFDEPIARAMKESGAQIVAFGVESGSQKMLNNMKKGATLEQAEKALETCKKVGLKAITYFVLGLPGETHETIDATIRFAIKLDAHIAQFFIATPFPGTEFYNMAKENGWLNTEDWTRYLHGASDVVSYPNLSAKDIAKRQKEAYRRFYFRPKKVVSYLRQTASLGQLKQNIKAFARFYRGRIKNSVATSLE